ncbi:MAG: hypothetical protein KME04_15810 [Pleurocapsa minor GSE-CHR-MK-17-07R]|jgi:hypothetical protein|nr:hypothetical protein [Pleurocapsa minor GSE-CHR-MK 17-07R]
MAVRAPESSAPESAQPSQTAQSSAEASNGIGNPRDISPANAVQLQRVLGNRAVLNRLQRSPDASGRTIQRSIVTDLGALTGFSGGRISLKERQARIMLGVYLGRPPKKRSLKILQNALDLLIVAIGSTDAANPRWGLMNALVEAIRTEMDQHDPQMQDAPPDDMAYAGLVGEAESEEAEDETEAFDGYHMTEVGEIGESDESEDETQAFDGYHMTEIGEIGEADESEDETEEFDGYHMTEVGEIGEADEADESEDETEAFDGYHMTEVGEIGEADEADESEDETEEFDGYHMTEVGEVGETDGSEQEAEEDDYEAVDGVAPAPQAATPAPAVSSIFDNDPADVTDGDDANYADTDAMTFHPETDDAELEDDGDAAPAPAAVAPAAPAPVVPAGPPAIHLPAEEPVSFDAEKAGRNFARGLTQYTGGNYLAAGVLFARAHDILKASGDLEDNDAHAIVDCARGAGASFAQGGDYERAAEWYRKTLGATGSPITGEAHAEARDFLASRGLGEQSKYSELVNVNKGYSSMKKKDIKAALSDKKERGVLTGKKAPVLVQARNLGKRREQVLGLTDPRLPLMSAYRLIILAFALQPGVLEGTTPIEHGPSALLARLVAQTQSTLGSVQATPEALLVDLTILAHEQNALDDAQADALLALFGVAMTQRVADLSGNYQSPMLAELDSQSVRYMETTADRDPYRLRYEGGMLMQGNSPDPFDTRELNTVAQGKNWAMFTMSPDGEIFAASHTLNQQHHSSLLAAGEAAGAGEMQVTDGQLVAVTNKSGHYLPNLRHLNQVCKELSTRLGQGNGEVRVINPETRRSLPFGTVNEYVALFEAGDHQAFRDRLAQIGYPDKPAMDPWRGQ